MATTLFLLDTVADTHLATDNVPTGGGTMSYTSKVLGTARGSGVASTSSTTVTGPTGGVDLGPTAGPRPEWISPPVSADVTIAGTITANVWASENNMSANVAINIVVEIIRANTLTTRNSNTLVEIARSTRVAEVAVTTRAVNNFTVTPTSTAMNRGDRLRIRIFGDDVGTMAAAFTFDASYNGTSAAADGDTYVTFTENFSFESAPGGSVLYLTDTASDVATASIDREAWTSRGSAARVDAIATVAGWTAPIQMTDVGGGTVVDWFSKQLQAFTLSGKAVMNIWGLELNVANNGSLRCELARVDSDGTNPTVWASWCIAPTGTDNGELTTTETARTANLSGDDLAFTDGQRIRIRVYGDDISSAAMGASGEVAMYYAVASGGAIGDTYITLPQSVSEYVAGGTAGSAMQTRRQRRASRYLTFR